VANVTLRDVAEKAEVSTATVSRVINGNGYVSPELKELVERTIDELGYVQNSVARSLITKTTHTIAYVTADIANPYMVTVARGIEGIARDSGYTLLMCSATGDPEQERECLKMLMARKVDALVLNGSGYNKELIVEISKQIPVALLHRHYNDPSFMGDYMGSDNDRGIRLLTKHLLSFGHRKIFILKGAERTTTHQERFNGFAATMKEAGIEVDKHYPYQYGGDFTPECGYNALEYICAMDDKPTAILAFNNTLGLGALKGIQENNIRVPEDLSVACFNGINHRELMSVRPTVYDIDPTEVGLQLGTALMERIENPGLPFRMFEPQGELITGNAVSTPTHSFGRKINFL